MDDDYDKLVEEENNQESNNNNNNNNEKKKKSIKHLKQSINCPIFNSMPTYNPEKENSGINTKENLPSSSKVPKLKFHHVQKT